jgi:hypothetical protein
MIFHYRTGSMHDAARESQNIRHFKTSGDQQPTPGIT